MVIGVIIISVAIGMTLFSARNVELTTSDIRAAEDLIDSATQLRQVAVETALFHEARSQDQWQRKIASVTREIDRMRITTPREKVNLENIRKKIELMQIIYPRLTGKAGAITARAGASRSELESAMQTRAVASLLVVTQEVIDMGHELIRGNRQESMTALRGMQVSIGLLLLAMGALIVFVWLLVSRRILQPLRIFEQGTRQLATGNYTHRLKLTQHDEIGDLGAAFDSMIVRIEMAALDLEKHRDSLAEVVLSRTAELLKAKDAAEKANRGKSEFLSSMSHELRTPLNAILGFAQLMESDLTVPTPNQKLSLDQILKAGWYLLELINEILDLAQIESGKTVLLMEPVSLVEVMNDCQSMVGPQASQRGISMTLAPLESAYFIEADQTRMKQVLINLLSNAIKYNQPGGAVTLACALVAPDSIRISIQDTGVGLTPQQLAQLFQPFNRLGRESGPEEGTGIGLTVTKRLVELMGGSIGVDSTVGVGSVFWIDFKLAKAPQLAIGDAAGDAGAAAAIG